MTGTHKVVSVGIATQLLRIFWPEFIWENGCVSAAFHGGSGWTENRGDKTQWECFINHTHIMDEFSNAATFQHVERISEELDEIEEIYDQAHPDFIHACEVGRKMAQMWATKLKGDFPNERFRVYYTQYYNPIVRFHKVRCDEHVWLSDEDLRESSDSSFRDTVIYDTDYLTSPVVKH